MSMADETDAQVLARYRERCGIPDYLAPPGDAVVRPISPQPFSKRWS
jgi:hypothetical protein